MVLGFLARKVLPPEKLAQVILGGQDGLVNTFGVILGVAAASGDIRIVIAGGLAACIAESISMGAVAYTSQRASHDHYISQLEKQRKLIDASPDSRKAAVRRIYFVKGFRGKELEKIVDLVTSNRQAWLSILMSEDSTASHVRNRDAVVNSVIVFLSALVGALVPLLPFFFFSLKASIVLSIILSAITLFGFGYYKAKTTVGKPLYSGLELLAIGFTAAILGYGAGWVFGVYV